MARKTYTQEFKQNAVRLLTHKGYRLLFSHRHARRLRCLERNTD